MVPLYGAGMYAPANNTGIIAATGTNYPARCQASTKRFHRHSPAKLLRPQAPQNERLSKKGSEKKNAYLLQKPTEPSHRTAVQQQPAGDTTPSEEKKANPFRTALLYRSKISRGQISSNLSQKRESSQFHGMVRRQQAWTPG